MNYIIGEQSGPSTRREKSLRCNYRVVHDSGPRLRTTFHVSYDAACMAADKLAKSGRECMIECWSVITKDWCVDAIVVPKAPLGI